MLFEIEYHNDEGPRGGFSEWWTVADDERSFRCDSLEDAEWLLEILNATKPDCLHD